MPMLYLLEIFRVFEDVRDICDMLYGGT